MKRFFVYLLFLFFSKGAIADIIPLYSHPIHKCVKIINTAEYPDFVLIARVKRMSGNSYTYRINPDQCLENGGYKFNTIDLFAIQKSKIGNRALDAVDWEKDSNCMKANLKVQCFGGYADNHNPIAEIEEYYKIAEIKAHRLILFKYKEIHKFIYGGRDEIKTYTYNSETDLPDTQNQSIEFPMDSFKLFRTHYSFTDFLQALLLTLLTETLVLFLLVRVANKKHEIKNKQIWLAGILASSLTLPFVWFALPLMLEPGSAYILTSEILATLAESFLLSRIMKIPFGKGLVWSIACNLCSLLLGWLVQFL